MSEIRNELLALRRKSDEKIHAEDGVEWAQRNPDSALNKALTWDDGKAAHNWRVHEVRNLIRIHLVVEDDPRRAPMVVSLSIDRHDGGGYRLVEDVRRNRTLSAVLMDDALADLNRAKRKFVSCTRLTSLWEELDRITREWLPDPKPKDLDDGDGAPPIGGGGGSGGGGLHPSGPTSGPLTH
jgi:hypothetical protein